MTVVPVPRLAAVSEQRIRVIAARLPATERAGDDAGSALLLEKITDPAQLRELAKLLARCTDRHLLLAATGYLTLTPSEAHAEFRRFRERGIARADMPSSVRDGERAYQRERVRPRGVREGGAEGIVTRLRADAAATRLEVA
jgi:hypothetical protein